MIAISDMVSLSKKRWRSKSANLSSVAAYLLAQRDRVELLVQALSWIWTPHGSADLDSFFAQQERETTHLKRICPGHLF